MKNDTQFYYRTFKDSFGRSQPDLIKWSKDHYLQVEENVDFKQYICATVYKYSDDFITKPKSSKYEKIRPVLGDLFEDYYILALKYISEVNIEDGEFYITKHSKDFIEIVFFSLDEKNKKSINIDFRDNIEDLYLSLICSSSYVYRPGVRKNGMPISKELFTLFLNLTLKYLSDHNSLNAYLNSYLKDFYKLVTGDKKIEGFDFSLQATIDGILEKIDTRVKHIERKLIEEDEMSKEGRIKLRGELEGLKYSQQVINVKK